MRGKFLLILGSLAAIAGSALPPPAWAGERVTLSNGFVEQCDHHAQVAGKVRLYLNAGEDSYIEFAPAEIATFEFVLDPPATAAPVSAPVPNAPTKLTTVDLHEMLTRAGAEHNIDIDLLASIIKAESGGNTRAVSRAGAQGLMQLMPGTAANLGVNDSFQPEQNVRGGSTYLDSLLAQYHDNLAFALAAYNAGPAAVDKYRGIPPYTETRTYVARVIHEFNRRVVAREQQAKRDAAAQAAQK
jgi:soluble lytic murein transglycosylase-like protein